MCQLILRYYQHCGHVDVIFDDQRCTDEEKRVCGPEPWRHNQPWGQSHSIAAQCIICFSTSLRLLAQEVNAPCFPPVLWRIEDLTLPWSKEQYEFERLFGRLPFPAQVEECTRWAGNHDRCLDHLDATAAVPGEPRRIDHITRMQREYLQVRCRPNHTAKAPWEVDDLRRFLDYLEKPPLEEPHVATANCGLTIIRFASCGHFNSVLVEKLDEITGKAACGCERFGRDMMVASAESVIYRNKYFPAEGRVKCGYAESLSRCFICNDHDPVKDRELKDRYWKLVKFDKVDREFQPVTWLWR